MTEKGYGEIKARAKIFPSYIDNDDLSLEKVKEVRKKVKKRKTGGNNNAWYYILQKAK